MDTNAEAKNNQDVMVSNLPLLFSDGKPRSLETLNAQDLQYFIPFLIKCILGCEPSAWVKYPKFKWWPDDVPWSPIILTRKHQTATWKKRLASVVRRCYEHNGCSYLLQFSARLELLPGFKFNDNWDGTTSMFDAKSGKLLVTFRNENMNYDKVYRQQDVSSRPTLLPRLNSPISPSKLGVGTPKPVLESQEPPVAKMVEPAVSDLYLCDYCGADFNSLNAIKEHEVKCMAEKASEVQSSINNALEEDTEEVDEAKFLWYLRLLGRNETGPPCNATPAKKYPPIKKPCTLIAKRFTTIPFSSNLGQSFFRTRGMSTAQAENLVMRYERFCVAKPVAPGAATNGDQVAQSNAPVTVASSRLRSANSKRKEEWVHTYSFNKADRRERMVTIATGLNKRARKLLQSCQPAKVVLHRMTAEEIEKWSRPKPKLSQAMLQPWLQKSIANLPSTCTVSLASTGSPRPWYRQKPITPHLVVTRPESAKQTNNKSQAEKRPPGEPPALFPLITNAWSMQTMQSVKPSPARRDFILPDLIPVVNRQPKIRAPQPVVINMPTPPKQKALMESPSVTITPSVRGPELVDLCSSDEEGSDSEQGTIISTGEDKPLVLPPGISVTKVDRSDQPSSALRARSLSLGTEQNNNRSMNRTSTPVLPKGHPPSLKFMGQSSARSKRKPVLENSALYISEDVSIQTVTPLRIDKMSVEKREQMKQSLKKIKKKEARTSPDSTERTGQENLANSPLVTSEAVGKLDKVVAKFGEAKRTPPGKPQSKQTAVRRKRIVEAAEETRDNCAGPPSKKVPRLDTETCLTATDDQAEIQISEKALMEIDMSSSDETRGSSRSSCFGSPEGRNGRKRNELSLLLDDECKELRRKGLEALPSEELSNQRVTRCRTKSLPHTSSKM